MNKKKTTIRQVSKAKIYVLATFNNTVVTAVDVAGNTLCWSSSGNCGFKGARRATPFAATQAVNKVLAKIKEFDVREIEVFLKGPGSGREAALRALKASGLKLLLIADITPIPHNGVRPKKKRRV